MSTIAHFSCPWYFLPLLLSLHLPLYRLLEPGCSQVGISCWRNILSWPCPGSSWRWTRDLWAITANSKRTLQEWQPIWESGTKSLEKPGEFEWTMMRQINHPFYQVDWDQLGCASPKCHLSTYHQPHTLGWGTVLSFFCICLGTATCLFRVLGKTSHMFKEWRHQNTWSNLLDSRRGPGMNDKSTQQHYSTQSPSMHCVWRPYVQSPEKSMKNTGSTSNRRECELRAARRTWGQAKLPWEQTLMSQQRFGNTLDIFSTS